MEDVLEVQERYLGSGRSAAQNTTSPSVAAARSTPGIPVTVPSSTEDEVISDTDLAVLENYDLLQDYDFLKKFDLADVQAKVPRQQSELMFKNDLERIVSMRWAKSFVYRLKESADRLFEPDDLGGICAGAGPLKSLKPAERPSLRGGTKSAERKISTFSTTTSPEAGAAPTTAGIENRRKTSGKTFEETARVSRATNTRTAKVSGRSITGRIFRPNAKANRSAV
jgi:hypothetical protein